MDDGGSARRLRQLRMLAPRSPDVAALAPGVGPSGDLGRGPPPRSSTAATGVRVRERPIRPQVLLGAEGQQTPSTPTKREPQLERKSHVPKRALRRKEGRKQ